MRFNITDAINAAYLAAIIFVAMAICDALGV